MCRPFHFSLASPILFTHQLSTIVLPLLASYAILSRSGDLKKVKLPVHGHLEEVLAEGDLRKPKRPTVEYVCTALITSPGLIIPSVIAVHGSEYLNVGPKTTGCG